MFKKVMCMDCACCTKVIANHYECRKNAPVPLNENTWAVWPVINIDTGWCGEGVTKECDYKSPYDL